MSLQKALEVLELPEELGQFDGQIKTRTQRQAWIYEVTDISSSPTRVYYTLGFDDPKTDAFGMYPLNYLANSIHQAGYIYEGINDEGTGILTRPGQFVKHEAPSTLAGQNVYYVWSQIQATDAGFEYLLEPYETVWKGVVDDMKDPMIRIGYKSRLVKKGPDGKPMVAWTSRYAITPKRRLRRSEFLQVANMTMEEFIYKTRWTYNRVVTDPETHINNIAMDIEHIGADQIKSVFYINGQDAQTFDYKTLINSFDKTYDGYLWLYRLNNGPGTVVDNVYGSTLNIGINPMADSTIKVVSGTTNAWDNNTKTLTYNPSLSYEAQIIAYAEFSPAQGKNENAGRIYSLEKYTEGLF